MRGIAMIILLAFGAQAHSQELTANQDFIAHRAASAQNFMDSLVEKFADKLVDHLLKVRPLHSADLANTTLGFARSVIAQPVRPVLPVHPVQFFPAFQRPVVSETWQPVVPLWSARGATRPVRAVLRALAPPSSALPVRDGKKVDVEYILPKKIVRDIEDNYPNQVSLNGNTLRLFGPNAGLQPGQQTLSKVTTLSDHAPMHREGIFSWNIMNSGRRLQSGADGKGYTNLCFQDIENALHSDRLGYNIEPESVYRARMYTIARVVLDMIEQSTNFRAFFLQEASKVLYLIFESKELRKQVERLNIGVFRKEQLITILSRDEFGDRWRYRNDEGVQMIAQEISAGENGLNLFTPRSYAIKCHETIFINAHVRVKYVPGKSGIAEAAHKQRAAALLQFASKVSEQYPQHMIYIGGDMNTYTNYLNDMNEGNHLISVHAGNAANGRGQRIPLPHPVDAIIVHERTQDPMPRVLTKLEQLLATEALEQAAAERKAEFAQRKGALEELEDAYLPRNPIQAPPSPPPFWKGPARYKPRISSQPIAKGRNF